MTAIVTPLVQIAKSASNVLDGAIVDRSHLRVIVKDAIRATAGVNDLVGRSGHSLSFSIVRRLSSWFDQASVSLAIQDELGAIDLYGQRTTLLTELAARLDYGRRDVCPPGHSMVR
ncbi:MAG: hypothetical protein ACREDZ_06045 [Kiloniellales bacterium]